MRLQQSYLRLAKRAATKAGRYAHAKKCNRHCRELRLLHQDAARQSFDGHTLSTVIEDIILEAHLRTRHSVKERMTDGYS